MLLYGAGGHAAVILDILRASEKEVSAIFDDDASKRRFLGRRVVGEYDRDYHADEELIISIGSNITRKQKAAIVKHKTGTAIHPTAIIAPGVEIQPGTVVMHGAIIQTQGRIGSHSIINTGARVDHECRIEDFAHISPGAILCGNVTIGEGTQVGAGAVIIPGIKVGRWATIGAGTVVIREIPDFAVVAGNPGRIIRYNEYRDIYSNGVQVHK